MVNEGAEQNRNEICSPSQPITNVTSGPSGFPEQPDMMSHPDELGLGGPGRETMVQSEAGSGPSTAAGLAGALPPAVSLLLAFSFSVSLFIS